MVPPFSPVRRGTFLLIAAILCFAGSAAAEPEYVFILKGRGNIFWKVIKQGIEESAAAQKITPIIYNTDDDQSPEAQLNICLAAIQRKPAMIVVGAATRTIGLACFKKATEAGIPIADIDGNVTVDDARAAGLKLAFTVGSDNYKIGALAAEHLKKIMPREDFSVLVIKGLAGSIVSENRTKGFLEKLKEVSPKAQVVAALSADWDRLKAMNIVQDTLQRVPELDSVFSTSDVMSMGIVEALRLSKREGKTLLISVDGIADARKALFDGKMAANVAQLPYLMGRRAVELSMSSVKGQTVERTEYVPTPVLTKVSIEQAKRNPDLLYVR